MFPVPAMGIFEYILEMSSEANLWLGFIGISFKDITKCVVFCILTVCVCVAGG
jgi:hypothetical protein